MAKEDRLRLRKMPMPRKTPMQPSLILNLHPSIQIVMAATNQRSQPLVTCRQMRKCQRLAINAAEDLGGNASRVKTKLMLLKPTIHRHNDHNQSPTTIEVLIFANDQLTPPLI